MISFDQLNVLKQLMICWLKCLFTRKKKILMITPSFKGGGLETRLNNIVNLYYPKYHFVLLTQTPKNEMKLSPCIHFRGILTIPFEKKLLTFLFYMIHFDILDIHPFDCEWIADLPSVSKKTRLIYTLHGIPSVLLFHPSKRPFDKIITVSTQLNNLFIQKFPEYADKIMLSKNTCQISNKHSKPKDTKKILFMLTNQTPIHEILNDIIEIVPPDFEIHYIGYPIIDTHKIKYYSRLIYDGFVDVSTYLNKNHFKLALCRGGYAAMDLIAYDIPTITVRENTKNGFYFDLITCDNFETLSNQNFVSWHPYCKKDLSKIIPLFSRSPTLFYNDCLNKFNSNKDIINYYE